MKNGFRQSMAWLHTWSGLLAGWILFAVFLTGTASYYRQEISAWMRPELHRAVARAEAAETAIATLQQKAPAARIWLIELPEDRNRSLRLSWSDRIGPGGFTSLTLDGAAETAPIRKTSGGDFFYYFHFDLIVIPFRLGRWLVCLSALAMLVAIVSGVIIHRRIFADVFTFRPWKAASRAWLDGHNALGVLALPYHLMITYTGLVTFALMLMPYGVDLAYTSRAVFQAELYGQFLPGPKTTASPMAPIPAMIEQAARHWDGGLPGRISVINPNDAGARVLISRGDTDRIAYTRQSILFDGTTGAILQASGDAGPVEQTWGVLYGLHLARFASPGLRALFFLSGLVGSAMVATGLVLWVVKRKRRTTPVPRSIRIAEILNVAAIAGLPPAMAALLWANRLLPATMPGRDVWEPRCFFGLWLAALLLAALRPARQASRDLFILAALLCAGLPVLNALTTPLGLATTLRHGDWAIAGIDLGVAAFAPAFAALAWRLARRPGIAAPLHETRRESPA